MDRRRLVPIAIAVLLVAGAATYLLTRDDGSAGDIVSASGTVDADQVQVSALVAGRVTTASLSEGDVVMAGDVLYLIDSAALDLQVAQAESAVRAARVAWDEARDDDLSDAEIAAKKALWEQSVAGMRIARLQRSYAVVTAPATGTVTSVAVAEGELANPGRTLATITKGESLFIRVFVPETAIGRVAVGDRASIETDAGDVVDGRIVFIASEAQFTPSNVETKDQRAKLVYEVRLSPEANTGLNPGMPVTVTFAE